jgi:hypothetical protein
MNETKPKKIVSRNIAVSLGIICIILIALIAYFTVTGISAQNNYNNLQGQVKDLNDIVKLSKSSVWLENYTVSVGGPHEWSTLIIANYAGYLLVEASSTSNDTWLAVDYSLTLPKTGTYSFDKVVNVSSYQQWNAFSILPTNNTISDTGVYVAAGCYTENANVTISMIYYY